MIKGNLEDIPGHGIPERDKMSAGLRTHSTCQSNDSLGGSITVCAISRTLPLPSKMVLTQDLFTCSSLTHTFGILVVFF